MSDKDTKGKEDMLRDSLGFIVSPDGGDTLAREGDYCLCQFQRFGALVESTYPDQAMRKLEVGWGYWTRHPLLSPLNCSRDQIISLIVFLGMIKDYATLWRLFARTMLRLGFAQNWRALGGKLKIPDTMIPFMGLFIRAFYPRTKLLWPLLWIFDLTLLIGAMIDCRPWRDPEDTDDTNSIAQHYQAALIMPTPLSAIARKLYVNHRPFNKGNSIDGETTPVMGAVAWYFDNPEFDKNKDFVALYRQVVERISRD